MGYLSITRLSLLIQEKLNKLNAGNLSASELDELKELTAELNERIVILHYKAEEARLLKMADDILTEREIPMAKQTVAEPIKLNLGSSPEPKVEQPKTENTPVEIPVIPVSNITTPVAEPVKATEPAPVVTPPAPVAEISVKTPLTKKTLAERMQKTKVDDLKKAIGLNQKFLFMNSLFEGENSSYNDAIEKLNNMPTIADARHYIRELAYIYSWNYEDENVVLFTEFVERRYL